MLSDSDSRKVPSEDHRPSSSKKRWQPPTPNELQQILPQYAISILLGQGGMGAVYKGCQINLDRSVAIKILPPGIDENDHGANYAERFKNEARAMARLSHPGIVSVYDSGETQCGLLYIVMEFIEGTDVQKMVSQQQRLHSQHAMAITAHVCDALQYAHERGIIHRDIKPANIMVGYDGVVKVADFGLAKMERAGESGLTQSGMAMGTFNYMAPEALMLGSSVDQRADIYAVGVMLYFMLTGRLPHGIFELPSMQVQGLDPRFDSIIAKAMREDRDIRYQTTAEMRHDLDGILTQPIIKLPSDDAKPQAVLQSPPQRSVARQSSPKQVVIVRNDKKKSPILWVFIGLICCLIPWLGRNKFQHSAGSAVLFDQHLTKVPDNAPFASIKPGEWQDVFPVALTYLSRKTADGGGYIGLPPLTGIRLYADHLVVNNPAIKGDETHSSMITFSDSVRIDGAFEAEMRVDASKDNRLLVLFIPIGSRGLCLNFDLWRKTIVSTIDPRLFLAPDIIDGNPHTLSIRVAPNGPGAARDAQVMSLRIDGNETFRWSGPENELPVINTSTKLTPRSNLLSFAINQQGQAFFNVSSYRLRSLGGSIRLTPKQIAGDSPTVAYQMPTRQKQAPDEWHDLLEDKPELIQKLHIVDSGKVGWKLITNGGFFPIIDQNNVALRMKLRGYKQFRMVNGWSQVPADGIFGHTMSIVQGNSGGNQMSTGWIIQTTVTDGEIQPASPYGATKRNPPLETLDEEFELELWWLEGQQKYFVNGKPILNGNAPLPGNIIALHPLGPIEFKDMCWRSIRTIPTGASTSLSKSSLKTQEHPNQTDAPATSARVSTSIPATPDAPVIPYSSSPSSAGIIAHFNFNENGPIGRGKGARMENGGLVISGNYKDLSAGNDKPMFECPGFDFEKFTIAVKMQHERSEDVLVVGGSRRWMAIKTMPGGNLEFSLQNRNHRTLIKNANVPLKKTFVLTVAGNLKAGPVLIYVDGRLVTTESVPLGLEPSSEDDKSITFVNYGNSDTLKGTVDELLVYNRVLNDSEIRSLAKPTVAQSNALLALPQGTPIWIDNKGRSLTADFVRANNTAVTVRLNGKELFLPLSNLSAESRQLANILASKAQNEESSPSVNGGFTNTLGMKFVPVPGTNVLFCIHETRQCDFAAFAKAVSLTAVDWKAQTYGGIEINTRNDEHPVTRVPSKQAVQFCAWLSQKEGRKYRLPTRKEWTLAANAGRNPEFPWGDVWPPPSGAGNFCDESYHKLLPSDPYLAGYNDTYPTSAPVMSFKPNSLGIYDLGGNVWEMTFVGDPVAAAFSDNPPVVGRGSSFLHEAKKMLSSASECTIYSYANSHDIGFRLVLETP